MIVDTLGVTNLRAIEEAEFSFLPGFNLIVGVNGVGKTSALDALGTCLSSVLKRTNRLRSRVKTFSVGDIRIGADALRVECRVRIAEEQYSYLIHQPRESSTPQKTSVGMPRAQVHKTPGISQFIGASPPSALPGSTRGRTLAVLFSTNRAAPSERTLAKGSAAGGMTAAFVESLTNRGLRFGEFAAWMKVQESLRGEHPAAQRVLEACEHAVVRFLPGYRNLRVERDDKPLLVIDRGATAIPVRHLSDGERGSLALVLDLTRRLSQANPELTDPASEAEAVVLIDELELHLHPKWQRQVVHNLTAAFPRCQFIATTHSPQIIGEVPHDHIQIISDGMIYSPPHSFGIDSNRVLEEVMDAHPRNTDAARLLADISRNIVAEQFGQARHLLRQMINSLGEDDPEVLRIKTLLSFLEAE